MFQIDPPTLVRIKRAIAWGAVALAAIVVREKLGISRHSFGPAASWREVLERLPFALGFSGIISLLVFFYPWQKG